MVSEGRGPEELFAYLRQIAPEALPKILGGAAVLSTTVFAAIVGIIADFYLTREPARALDALKYLEKTERFTLNVGMMDQKVKLKIRTALEENAKNASEQDRAKIAALKKY
jgi:flagellar basal body-associated protein FliL